MAVCFRCGHQIPEGRKSFQIIYESKNHPGSMSNISLCLFCREAFDRFLINEPTTKVKTLTRAKKKENRAIKYGEPITPKKQQYFSMDKGGMKSPDNCANTTYPTANEVLNTTPQTAYSVQKTEHILKDGSV